MAPQQNYLEEDVCWCPDFAEDPPFSFLSAHPVCNSVPYKRQQVEASNM